MDIDIQEQSVSTVEPNQSMIQYENTARQLYHYVEFDDIDVAEDIKIRSQAFAGISPEEQRFLQKQLVVFSRNNDPRMLNALRMMGKETDGNFIDQLEQQSGGGKLDNLRIATHLFSLTYRMWEINNLVRAGLLDDGDSQLVTRQKLQEIREAATALSKYTIEATHVTHPEFEEAVDKDQLILKSASGEVTHFEGDGVYAGILGSYRDWNSGKVYEFPLSLADTLPICQVPISLDSYSHYL